MHLDLPEGRSLIRVPRGGSPRTRIIGKSMILMDKISILHGPAAVMMRILRPAHMSLTQTLSAWEGAQGSETVF